MLSFKEFFSEQNKLTEENMSHEIIGGIGDRLDHIKNSVLGRKSKAQIVTDYAGGVPVVFGLEPKTGQPFVSDGKHIHYDEASIQKKHKDAPEAKAYSDVLNNMQKILPREGGVYSGQYMKFNKGKGGNLTNGSAVIDGKSADGKKAKNAQFSLVVSGKNNKPANLSKFTDHPDVHLIDPVLKANPATFTPEHQQAYNHNMMAANKSYSSLKPDAFDKMHPGHHDEISKFLSTYQGDKVPKIADYMTYLTQSHTQEAESKLGPKQKDRVIRRLNDLQTTATPEVNKMLSVNWHLNNAHNVLRDAIAKQPKSIVDPNAVISVYHNGQKTPL
jgi:hypothetical protein